MAILPEVRALGFDERFIRMWDYYLALSEAGFATGLVQDQQLVLEKARGVVIGRVAGGTRRRPRRGSVPFDRRGEVAR